RESNSVSAPTVLHAALPIVASLTEETEVWHLQLPPELTRGGQVTLRLEYVDQDRVLLSAERSIVVGALELTLLDLTVDREKQVIDRKSTRLNSSHVKSSYAV